MNHDTGSVYYIEAIGTGLVKIGFTAGSRTEVVHRFTQRGRIPMPAKNKTAKTVTRRIKLPTKGDLAADAVIAWCAKRGYPLPTKEHRFCPERRWRFDLSWDLIQCPGIHPQHVLLAVEINGGGWINGRHNRASSLEAEYEKLANGAALGYRIIPITYSQLERGDLWPLLDLILGER